MPVKLHVSAPYALFTRPEMKVERVSYDVITPSAARGVLEAIYWKPQIRWVVDRIHVLKPIRFTSVRRNEVGHRIPMGAVKSARNSGRGDLGQFIEDDRQQRASLVLLDVAYLIEAHFVVLDFRFERGGPELPAKDCEGKHLDMFNRRARAGQCFQQPYLGCREFVADFHLHENAPPPPPDELRGVRELGYMLHDLDYTRDRTPRFFRATLHDGVLIVPALHSEEVRT